MTIESNNKNLITAFKDLCLGLSQGLPKSELLEKILECAQSITKADGATLYIKNGESLRFSIIKNNTLNINLNADSAPIKTMQEIPLDPMKDQHSSVSAHCAITKKNVNVEEISSETNIDLAPTQAFDAKFGYKTKSILAVPILDKKKDVLGVMQLINAQNTKQKFNDDDVQLCEAMVALASMTLSAYS